MKKSLSLILTVILLFTLSLPCAFAAENERVEISFRVGESVLKINGTDVAVETPYVVGEGVTLVPLRVITEAFGAKVSWDGDTQTVTLDYPGVNIILQIGNPIAEVNGKTQTLLAAPELPGSSTMVPLRFISETFGATVSYDEATEAILVVKEAGTPTGSALVGGVDAKRIGDSYFNWSMENPKQLTMEHRQFDGTLTAFTAEGKNLLTVSVSSLADDYTLQSDLLTIKASLYEYALVEEEVFTDKNAFHLQARDADIFMDIYVIATNGYRYILTGAFANETPALRDECLRVMSTFVTEYTPEETHDLSNIRDGKRTFEDRDFNISIDIPADHMLITNEKAKNQFLFAKPGADKILSGTLLSIYSKTKDITAQNLAYRDLTNYKNTLNESLATFSVVQQVVHGSINTYEFFINIDKSAQNDCFYKSYYWEIGEYVYHLSVEVKKPFDGNVYEYTDSIMQSVKASPIDADKIGTIEATRPQTSGMTVCKPKGEQWELNVPNTYENTDIPGEDGATFEHKLAPAYLYYNVQLLSKDYVFVGSVSGMLSTSEKQMADKYENVVILQSPKTKTIGTKEYVCDIVRYTDDDVTIYLHRYAVKIGTRQFHQFNFYTTELYHSQALINEVEGIIATMKSATNLY